MDQHAQAVRGGALFADLPVRCRQVDIRGTSTAVVEGGQGRPLVLLHGAIQAGGVVWWRVLPRLLQRHRIVVADLPGLGQSAPLPALDADTFRGWFAALLRATCEEPPTVVAHSAPAALAARFAARHGDALRALVLVDAAGLAALRPPPAFLVALLRANARPSRGSTERFLRRVMVDLDRTRASTGEDWNAFVEDVAVRSTDPVVKQTMRRVVRAGISQLPEEELGRITVPTALLWGGQDPLIPLKVAQAASDRRGWPLRVVDDAGHLPHVERPAAFAEALEDLAPAAG